MNNIREKRGLAYSVSSSFDAGLQPGSVSVSLETKNASASTAVEEVLREIKRLRAEPVTSEELEDAKSYLIGSFPRKIDSLSKRAWILAYVELYGLGLDYPFRYPGLIRGLTPADIQRVAEKYLHPDRYLLVVVGNKAEMPKFDSGTAPPGSMEKKHVPKPTQEPG
jgi:zinc protease